MHAAGFSPDSSLVVLVHGLTVTLWDSARNVFMRTLESTVDGRKLGFAGPEGRYIVVSGGKTGVAVWDLLSCELVQTLPTLAADMVVALPTGILAARSIPPSKGQQPKTEVAFLSPSGAPGPTVTLRVLLSALAALPGRAIHLVGMAPSGEIYRFGELQKASAPSKRAISATVPARRATSIWQEMFGRDAFLDELAAPTTEEPAAVSALQRRAAGRPEAVFDGPSHTLPPIGMLFDAFMDELLAPRAEDGDAPMLVDDEEVLAPASSTLAVDAVRAVNDREVAELEGFFRNLRTSAPAKPVLGKAAGKKRPNGIPMPNGHARAVSTPTKSSKKDSRPATPATPDEPEIVDGKRKSKKRKAPRHSEA